MAKVSVTPQEFKYVNYDAGQIAEHLWAALPVVRFATARAEAIPKLSLYERPSEATCRSPGDS